MGRYDFLIKEFSTCGNSLLRRQTLPISKLDTAGLRYVPEIKSKNCDLFTSSRRLEKADKTLFSWAKPKPEFSMTQVNPDSLVMVHMTNYFPKNGEILSTNLATRTVEGVGCSRTTIHFALNKPVTEHAVGNAWNTMDYAIIAPFKETVQGMPKSKVIGGIQDDFFFQDIVKLPKGSVIVKHNPNVPQNQFLTSDAFEGIKLIETSNRNLNESAGIVLQKMGFITYNDALKKFLGATNEEMKLLTSVPEAELIERLQVIEKQGGFKKIKAHLEEGLQMTKNYFSDNSPQSQEILRNAELNYATNIKSYNILEKYSDKLLTFPKTWNSFCSKQGYLNGLHSQSPWFKAEMSISGVEMVEKLNNNTWTAELKDILINTLNESVSTLPKGKNLGFDAKKAAKIIEESETPKIARIRLAEELKIKSMPPKQESLEVMNNFGENDTGANFLEFVFQILGLRKI